MIYTGIYYEIVGRAVMRDKTLYCLAETPELANEIAQALEQTHWDRWETREYD